MRGKRLGPDEEDDDRTGGAAAGPAAAGLSDWCWRRDPTSSCAPELSDIAPVYTHAPARTRDAQREVAVVA